MQVIILCLHADILWNKEGYYQDNMYTYTRVSLPTAKYLYFMLW